MCTQVLFSFWAKFARALHNKDFANEDLGSHEDILGAQCHSRVPLFISIPDCGAVGERVLRANDCNWAGHTWVVVVEAAVVARHLRRPLCGAHTDLCRAAGAATNCSAGLLPVRGG